MSSKIVFKCVQGKPIEEPSRIIIMIIIIIIVINYFYFFFMFDS